MKKNTILILLFTALICIVRTSNAQNIPFEKKAFPNQKDEYKIAYKNYKDGNAQFNLGYYNIAKKHYLKANKFNPNNALLNYQIGLCYLNTIERYSCLKYFEQAFLLDRNVQPEIHYMLGQGCHLNNQFEKAIIEYKAFLATGVATAEEKNKVNKLIVECQTGKLLVKKDCRAFVDNVGATINSKNDDHSPLISADAQLLIFTSSRDNGKKADADGDYDEDIYLSHIDGKNWLSPEPIGEPINTKFNDATVGLSPDGQTLLIYNGNRGNGDLQTCHLEGNDWDFPKNLPKTINSDYWESSACFSPDGNQLYFISNRPGGYGGKDIWISTRSHKGKWKEAYNLGEVINSHYDEETVFMHPDGRTLYFSSRGHKTMGGYDIFVSHKQDNGQWTDPENLGYPINTPDDDLCFVISANGRYGYSSSERPGGLGGLDIYKMTFLGPEKPLVLSNEDNLIAIRENPVTEMVLEESVELKTIRLTIVKGTVKDAFTMENISADIDIIDNEKNEVIFTSKTNSISGSFLVSLPSGKNYGLAVQAKDYLFHSENFNIPKATEYQEISKNILLHNVKKDAKIVLNNVFFETGSSKLKPTSYAELGRLTKMLTDYPDLKIEISGHTDNKGSQTTNQRLSENRAKAVVDFLISEGTESSRLEYKGYAFSEPIADNNTEEGRSRNRRVEFKILSN